RGRWRKWWTRRTWRWRRRSWRSRRWRIWRRRWLRWRRRLDRHVQALRPDLLCQHAEYFQPHERRPARRQPEFVALRTINHKRRRLRRRHADSWQPSRRIAGALQFLTLYNVDIVDGNNRD